MNTFKNFMIRNRHLAALTIGVSIVCIAIFSVLAILFLDIPKAEASEKNPETSSNTSATSASSNTNETETSSDAEIIIGTLEPQTTVRETLPSEELPYLIMVNRAMNCVTIYSKDETGQFTVPVKAMTCSVGREGHDTPLGTYVTSDQFMWAVMADSTRAQYVYRFKGPYLFHSVPYLSASKNDLETEEFNKLGEPASLGCVRLCVADAKWIYENCDINTTVILYDDPSSPGPLGKPDTIKIPLNSPYKGWDPTDPDPANPWLNYSATIKAKEKSIKLVKGSSLEDLLSCFTIKDTCGNEIPEKATVAGNYNLNICGTYTVTVNVTDAIGSTASLDVTFMVVNELPSESTTKNTTTDKDTTKNTTNNTTTKNNNNTTKNNNNTTDNNTTTNNDNSNTTPDESDNTETDDITTKEDNPENDSSTDSNQ
ncbi:MAG: L,D-transpeptidase [Lachnospiraceae bacterium]|nr:L,D-transpeptidase [Lachnospiraceae bacterium]